MSCEIKFCGDESCIKCLNSGSIPFYDPIGRHLKELRECAYKLNEQITQHENLKNTKKKKNKLPTSDPYLFISIPNFPKAYPFKGSMTTPIIRRQPRRIKLGCNLPSENQIKNLEVYFVQQVLAHNGYYVAELSGEASTSVSGEASTSVQSVESGTSAVHVLSNELHHLLETISKCMMRHKRSVVFSQCDDLWGPLETTLQQDFDFGGIKSLHEYYYENFIKKHDAVFEVCINMLKKYDEIKTDDVMNLKLPKEEKKKAVTVKKKKAVTVKKKKAVTVKKKK